MHDFNGVGDLLRFSPLSPAARLRLGLVRRPVPAARRRYEKLETIPLEALAAAALRQPGLSSGSGSRCWTRASTATPAGCRRPTSGPAPAHVRGPPGQGQRRRGDGPHRRRPPAPDRRDGRRAAASSAWRSLTDAPVSGLAIDDDGAVTGVELGERTLEFDLTIPTLQPPALRFLLPERHQGLLEPYPQRWLGCVCLIVKVKRSLHALLRGEHRRADAADQRGRDHAGARHRAHRRLPPRLPAEVLRPGRARAERGRRVHLPSLHRLSSAKLAPGFSRDEVVDWTVQRAKLVEPVHQLRPAAASASPRSGPGSTASRSPPTPRSTPTC